MPAAVNKKPSSEGRINGIIRIIDKSKGKLSSQDIEDIRSFAVDALSLLSQPDSDYKRVCIIVLVFQQSTSIVEHNIDGKLIKRYQITNHDWFAHAVEMAHSFIQERS